MKSNGNTNWILIACTCAILASMLWRNTPETVVPQPVSLAEPEGRWLPEDDLPTADLRTAPFPIREAPVIAPVEATPEPSFKLPAGILFTKNPYVDTAEPSTDLADSAPTDSERTGRQGLANENLFNLPTPTAGIPGLASQVDERPVQTPDTLDQSGKARSVGPMKSQAVNLPIAPPTHVIPVSTELLWTKIEKGEALARRNAWATAQQEFVEVLQQLGQQMDLKVPGGSATSKINEALTALEEVGDFLQTGDSATRSVSMIVARHESRIINPDECQEMTHFQAAQAYYSAVRVLFHEAFQKNRMASRTLFDLGKLNSLWSIQAAEPARHLAHAMLFHYAALDCDDRNFPAANELGVMLAQNGQLREARDVLRHCVNVQPTLSACQSLAKIERSIGDVQAAEQTEALAVRLDEPNAPQHPNEFIPFVDAQAFNSIPDFGDATATIPNSGTAPSPAESPGERVSERQVPRWQFWR